jgi:hypothetical protein
VKRLERRYRLLLRALPGWYRREYADERVAVFLADEMGREEGWPGWPEVRSIAALAVHTRLAASTGPPHALALGQAVRLVALLGLLVQSAQALAAVESVLVRGLLYPQTLASSWLATVPGAGTLLVTLTPLVLLVLGRRGWAKLTAVLATLPGLVPLTGCTLGPNAPPDCGAFHDPTPVWSVIAVNLPLLTAVVCLCGGFHRQAPTPKAPPWLLALTVAAEVILLAHLLTAGTPSMGLTSNPGTATDWALSAGGLVYLGLVATRGFDPAGAWATAIAAYTAATLPAQLVMWSLLQRHNNEPGRSLPLVLTGTPIVATTLVVLVIGTVAGSRLPARPVRSLEGCDAPP